MKTFYILGCAILLGGTACWAKPRICIEAEDASRIEFPVQLCKKGPHGVSDDCLEIREGIGNPPKVTTGRAIYELDIPKDGSYYFWARVWWNGECSNSMTVSIDWKKPFLFGEDSTYRVWHWVRYPVSRTGRPLLLTKGKHRLELQNREDGIWIDQILLTTDKRYVPVDIERVTD